MRGLGRYARLDLLDIRHPAPNPELIGSHPPAVHHQPLPTFTHPNPREGGTAHTACLPLLAQAGVTTPGPFATSFSLTLTTN